VPSPGAKANGKEDCRQQRDRAWFRDEFHDVPSDVLIVVMQIAPGFGRRASDEAEVMESVLGAWAEVVVFDERCASCGPKSASR
jgi:hypothetical protein